MVKWAAEIYNGYADAKAAIELIDNTTRLEVIPFKDGSITKVLVLTGGTY